MSSASTLVSTFSPNLSQTFSQTFSPGTAYRAEAVARAERDLTASTDRYMRHAAHALALAAVRELRDAIRAAGVSSCAELSMGMTNDMEIAVKEGSTQVRVGTAVFGPRPFLRTSTR